MGTTSECEDETFWIGSNDGCTATWTDTKEWPSCMFHATGVLHNKERRQMRSRET